MTRTQPEPEPSGGFPGRVSVHDAVLAAIPASLAVATVVGFVLSLSVGTTLAAGSVPAVGTVGYALFYNPPGRGVDGSGRS